MNSYSTTTLLPPSPSRWCPHEIPLPESDKELVIICLRIDRYLDELWTSYLRYAELVMKPEATKIFAIIFTEMDFFEIIKGRAIDKMSDKTAIRGML
jgi:hypothetical protein